MTFLGRLEEEILDIVKAGYVPGEETVELLRERELYMLLGPTGVGKGAMLHELLKHHGADLGKVHSFTTREPRPDETTEYDFLRHDEANLEMILKGLQHGSYVNCVVHPTTGMIYGSHIEAYGHLSIIDMQTNGVASIEQVFGRELPKIFIATDPDIWLSRQGNRSIEFDELQKRLNAAKPTIEWGLEREDDIFWVYSPDQSTPGELAAAQVADIMLNGRSLADFDSSKGLEMARRMLDKLEAM